MNKCGTIIIQTALDIKYTEARLQSRIAEAFSSRTG